jgi:hypothetical protein
MGEAALSALGSPKSTSGPNLEWTGARGAGPDEEGTISMAIWLVDGDRRRRRRRRRPGPGLKGAGENQLPVTPAEDVT